MERKQSTRMVQDREDLLTEAVALIRRVEFLSPTFKAVSVAGFRENGSFSLYIGAGTVYQFNDQAEFRRGFLNGEILKAEDGKIIALKKLTNGPGFQSIIWPDYTMAAFLQQVRTHLFSLKADWSVGNLDVLRQVPSDQGVMEEVVEWVTRLPLTLMIAQQPNVSAS